MGFDVKYIIIIGLAAMMFLLASNAKGDGYVGMKASYIDAKDANFTGAFLVGGYNVNNFVGFEARTIVNSSDEAHRGSGMAIDSMYGIYITATVPVFDDLSVNALFGHSASQIDSDSGLYDHDGNSSSMGFGITYEHLEAWHINFEALKMFDNVDVYSLGVKFKF